MSTAISAQGSTFYIGVSGGTSKNVTAITKADPAVVTTSGAHGLSDGNLVKFASAAGMTQINGRIAMVDVVTTSQFRAYGINSTAFTSYSGSGTVINNKWKIGNVRTYSESGAQKPQQDVTDLDSTRREFVGGVPDGGTITIGGLFKSTDDGQEALQAGLAMSGGQTTLQTTLSDSTIDKDPVEVMSFDRSLTESGTVEFSATLKKTGNGTRTLP